MALYGNRPLEAGACMLEDVIFVGKLSSHLVLHETTQMRKICHEFGVHEITAKNLDYEAHENAFFGQESCPWFENFLSTGTRWIFF